MFLYSFWKQFLPHSQVMISLYANGNDKANAMWVLAILVETAKRIENKFIFLFCCGEKIYKWFFKKGFSTFIPFCYFCSIFIWWSHSSSAVSGKLENHRTDKGFVFMRLCQISFPIAEYIHTQIATQSVF